MNSELGTGTATPPGLHEFLLQSVSSMRLFSVFLRRDCLYGDNHVIVLTTIQNGAIA